MNSKDIKVVIGANFGDEGKGLMTDYFCERFNKNQPVLNVRFNGGSQAGHTVVKEDGRRHVFHHFGAGSFNSNVSTYLSEYFIVNPILFRQEYEQLLQKGVKPKVYVNSECIITFPCDMMINQFVEKHRSGSKHGSCGVGIYETVLRNRNHKKLTISHVNEKFCKLPLYINEAVVLYTPERLKELGIKLDEEQEKLIINEDIYENYMDDVAFMLNHIDIVDNTILDIFHNIVFEGAQGLLLDCANKEYYPHLTPSSTGLENVMKILNELEDVDITICYVTRSYFTRHGVGLFKTECKATDINEEGLLDKTNVTNEYQGIFRYGYFDVETIKNAVNNDIKFLNRVATVGLAMTHLDETGGMLITPNKINVYPSELLEILHMKLGYESYGEKCSDIKLIK